MENIQTQIQAIEKEIRETPYHKGTERHIGLLRARLAKLRDRIIEKSASRRSGGGGGFAIRKFGDATVVLVGFPSVGKSTLLNALTNAKSPTAEYAFTTVTVIPGMMKYKGASIQILDVPGLIEGAATGAGKGREVLSVVRGADLLLIMAEAGRQAQEFNRLNSELYSNGVRLNDTPPSVDIKKTLRGGLKINSSSGQTLDKQTIGDVAKEFGTINAEITLKEKLTMDRLIDAFAENRVYVPALYVVNKADNPTRILQGETLQGVALQGSPEFLEISAKTGAGLDKLKEAIWDKLGLVRVYLKKRRDGVTDYEEPMIMRKGDSLQTVAEKIGTEFAEDKKLAKIWGSGAAFPGQEVSLKFQVQDGLEVMFLQK